MEEMNNNINPNQQPQEEEEKKKKNKFVAWWLGLGKWAKVGICAGTAAVIATAITLPIVLTPKTSSHDISILFNFGSAAGFAREEDYPTKIKSTDTSFTYKILKSADEAKVEFKLQDQNKQTIEKSTFEFNYTTEPNREHTVTGLNLTNVTEITVDCVVGQ